MYHMHLVTASQPRAYFNSLLTEREAVMSAINMHAVENCAKGTVRKIVGVS